MSRSRLVIWTIIGFVAFLAGVWAFWPRAVLVDTAEVVRGPMEVSITEEGEARVRDLFVVSAPATGYLNRIEIDPGECVTAGTSRLADIHSPTATIQDVRTQAQLRAAADSARAALRMADADVRLRQTELDQVLADRERMRRLARTGTVSAQALERAEANATSHMAALAAATSARDVARFEVTRAEAALIPANAAFGDGVVSLTSPVTGMVLRVMRDSEGPIAAGTPIMEIGASTNLEVVVDVLSEDAVRIQTGTKVRVRGWGGDPQWAYVERVEPYAFTKISALGIEEQRTNVIVRFDSAMPGLGHGYRVRADILIWEASDVIRVPMSALFKTTSGWTVYRIERGRAKLRPVSLGRMNGRQAEVLNGLSAGDMVVQHPSSALEDGVKVQAREASKEANSSERPVSGETTSPVTPYDPCDTLNDAFALENTLNPSRLVERDDSQLNQPERRP
ncbi:MAG: efflux RND transporter periplasmic adaptor subunit [Henriciella sp.]